MRFPPDVTDLLTALLSAVQTTLHENLVGLYVRGSLAQGGFVPETSDVDLLAVTERAVGQVTFEALAAMHSELNKLANPYANRVEIAYLDRPALRRYLPGICHPTLGQGETLAWTEHHSNWILERWTLRESGVTLYGQDPRTLVDPVATHELVAAVRDRLVDWEAWARDVDDPDWLLPRSHKAYVVETMCRAMHTLTTGRLASKAEAVAWAQEALPERWRETVRCSRSWRTDATRDLAIVPEVRALVLWAASDGQEH